MTKTTTPTTPAVGDAPQAVDKTGTIHGPKLQALYDKRQASRIHYAPDGGVDEYMTFGGLVD